MKYVLSVALVIISSVFQAVGVASEESQRVFDRALAELPKLSREAEAQTLQTLVSLPKDKQRMTLGFMSPTGRQFYYIVWAADENGKHVSTTTAAIVDVELGKQIAVIQTSELVSGFDITIENCVWSPAGDQLWLCLRSLTNEDLYIGWLGWGITQGELLAESKAYLKAWLEMYRNPKGFDDGWWFADRQAPPVWSAVSGKRYRGEAEADEAGEPEYAQESYFTYHGWAESCITKIFPPNNREDLIVFINRGNPYDHKAVAYAHIFSGQNHIAVVQVPSPEAITDFGALLICDGEELVFCRILGDTCWRASLGKKRLCGLIAHRNLAIEDAVGVVAVEDEARQEIVLIRDLPRPQ